MTQPTDIRTLLRKAGVTAATAAGRLGIDASSMSLKLSGKRPIRIEEARVLLAILNEPAQLKELGRKRTVTFEEVFGMGAQGPSPAKPAVDAPPELSRRAS